MLTDWLSALNSPVFGVALGLAAGFLMGRIWRNLRLRDRLLLLEFRLDVKTQEAVALRRQVRRLRARMAGIRPSSLRLASGSEVKAAETTERRLYAKKEFSDE